MKNITVLMTVSNAFSNDPRARKEARSLNRAGFHVIVCALDRTLSFSETECIEGIVVKRLRMGLPFGRAARALLVMPIFILFGVKHSLAYRPRIIHCHDLDTLIVGVVNKLLFQSRLVYDAHEHYPSNVKAIIPLPMFYLLAILDRVLTSAADCVIVPSRYRARLYPTARRIIELPNVPSKAGIVRSHRDSDAFTIYYGGSLSRETAIFKLIRLASRSRDLRLVLAGDGPLRGFVEKNAASLPNIAYLGRVDGSTSLELLGGSDMTVVMYEPSNINFVYASSNKLFEAMMMGIPIITNKETVLSEIVEGEACGLIVPYHDDVALQRAIRLLKDDPALRRILGDNGRTASQKYCWESVEGRLLLGYKELLRGSNRSLSKTPHLCKKHLL